MAAHPRDPQTVWTIPLTEPEDGPGHARRPRRGLAHERRRRRPGAQATTACPRSNAYLGVLREAMAVDRLDPVGVYFGTSTGQLYGSRDEGRTLVADRRQPAVDLVGRGGDRRLTAMADVHLPRSLVGAVPGRPAPPRGTRRDRRRGDRGPRRPGPRDPEPAARRRPDASGRTSTSSSRGERATLATPVPAGATVHVIPAVSGG